MQQVKGMMMCGSAMLVLAACSSAPPCEDILEVNHQLKTCQSLAKIMTDNRYPQQALTARKRYQQECEDMRYYRDGYDTICKGNQPAIGQRQERQPPVTPVAPEY
ncbi:hypothetical protein OCL06_06325 [Alteromonas sp. ASW11-19]|uniref:Lipoprotein n=1 Tax=Alteromonas salexigens TaxID=2982530 RepID=A0ABT2VMW9_9ALTE|nr:hypothetical protein [Alteromonas salexigens]MCU7554207.1 hypothetical protein [Alteromonas salexigens]